MIRTMTPENMCQMTPTPPLPPHGHYPCMHRDMYLKPEPMISQYHIGPATSGSGDMQQTQMLHQLLQHPQGQEWVRGEGCLLQFETPDMISANAFWWRLYRSIPVHQAKKRKHSDSPNSTLNSQILTGIIKQEPGRQASFFPPSPPLPHAHLLLLTRNTDLQNRTYITLSFNALRSAIFKLLSRRFNAGCRQLLPGPELSVHQVATSPTEQMDTTIWCQLQRAVRGTQISSIVAGFQKQKKKKRKDEYI